MVSISLNFPYLFSETLSSARTESCSTAPFPNLAIYYISKPFISDRDSPYAQAPGSEVDSAWDSLLSGMHMRASAKELVSQGQRSVSLEGNDQYLVWLDVYHQLHCIVSTFLSLASLVLMNNRICCENGYVVITTIPI
jgi:hypothetical protein